MNWLKDCEICNVGLCKTVDEMKRQGLSENAASKQMSEESEGLYSKEAIKARYRHHTGRAKRRVCENHTPIKRLRLTDAEKEKIMTEDFKAGFEVFLREIRIAKQTKWEQTSKEAALRYVEILYDVITV